MEGWKDWLNRDKDVEEIPREKVSSISDIATGAELSEDATMVLRQLKDILEEWQQAEYESDEQRWQAYAEDIQRLVGEHEGTPAEEEIRSISDIWTGENSEEEPEDADDFTPSHWPKM